MKIYRVHTDDHIETKNNSESEMIDVLIEANGGKDFYTISEGEARRAYKAFKLSGTSTQGTAVKFYVSSGKFIEVAEISDELADENLEDAFFDADVRDYVEIVVSGEVE